MLELAHALLPEIRRTLHQCHYRYKVRVDGWSKRCPFITLERRGMGCGASIGIHAVKGLILNLYPADDGNHQVFELADPLCLDKLLAELIRLL